MTTNTACRERELPTGTERAVPAATADVWWAEASPHGAMTYAEAAKVLGPAELVEALDQGGWIQPWWGVVVPEHRMRDPLTRAAAALLRAGPCSVLSGSTAAAMHGCTAAESPTLQVTIPYDRQMRSLPGLSVRQAWVQESEVLELDGLRVQVLDVALSELLCTGPQRMALACLEQALAQFAGTNADHLRALVGQRIARRRDRRGTRQATGLLELAWARPPGTAPSGEAEGACRVRARPMAQVGAPL